LEKGRRERKEKTEKGSLLNKAGPLNKQAILHMTLTKGIANFGKDYMNKVVLLSASKRLESKITLKRVKC
jgi:hypothetical protein